MVTFWHAKIVWGSCVSVGTEPKKQHLKLEINGSQHRHHNRKILLSVLIVTVTTDTEGWRGGNALTWLYCKGLELWFKDIGHTSFKPP